MKNQKKLEDQQLEVNDWEEFGKAIIHPKELLQTEQSLEKQLAEAIWMKNKPLKSPKEASFVPIN